MKHTLFIIFILVSFFQLCTAKTADRNHVAYVEQFLRLYPDRLSVVMEYMPVIEKHCLERGIEPVDAVVIASLESSFRQINGDRGERGWFQVMPNSVCATGFDLDTIEGQIASGINCIALARNACDGSLIQTLTMYASGSCTARTKTTRKKMRYRAALIERWRR